MYMYLLIDCHMLFLYLLSYAFVVCFFSYLCVSLFMCSCIIYLYCLFTFLHILSRTCMNTPHSKSLDASHLSLGRIQRSSFMAIRFERSVPLSEKCCGKCRDPCVRTYLYMHVYICIYIYMHVYIYIYIYICT